MVNTTWTTVGNKNLGISLTFLCDIFIKRCWCMSILLKKHPKNEKRHILTEGAQLEWLLTIPLQIWGDSHKNGHMNEAWAVNQWSRGFTAQLSESWAYLSPYSAEQKKKHTLLSLHFLALSLPSTSSRPPSSPSSVMNGRYEFSSASPGFSLRPSAAEQTTRSQLKGAIRNLFEPCTFRVYLCMALKRSRRNMEKRFL